jgi:hypothetical protein
MLFFIYLSSSYRTSLHMILFEYSICSAAQFCIFFRFRRHGSFQTVFYLNFDRLVLPVGKAARRPGVKGAVTYTPRAAGAALRPSEEGHDLVLRLFASQNLPPLSRV